MVGTLFTYGTHMNDTRFGYADRTGLGVVITSVLSFKAHCVFSPCHFQSEHTGTAKCNICSLKHHASAPTSTKPPGFHCLDGCYSLRENELAAWLLRIHKYFNSDNLWLFSFCLLSTSPILFPFLSRSDLRKGSKLKHNRHL